SSSARWTDARPGRGPARPDRCRRRTAARSQSPSTRRPAGAAARASAWDHVGGIHLDADRLIHRLHRDDEMRVRALAHETAAHARERTAHHLDALPFADEGTGVARQLARDETAD